MGPMPAKAMCLTVAQGVHRLAVTSQQLDGEVDGFLTLQA